MALTWSVENVAEHEEKCWIETGETNDGGKPTYRLNPVTESLIWGTMTVGMHEITEENAEEFAARAIIAQEVLGPWLSDGEGNGVIVGWQHVYAHVGLRTNASDYEEDEFLKRLAPTKMQMGRARHAVSLTRQAEEASPERNPDE